eukprot:6187297-Pleurochrysis_carterae.AAC.1
MLCEECESFCVVCRASRLRGVDEGYAFCGLKERAEPPQRRRRAPRVRSLEDARSRCRAQFLHPSPRALRGLPPAPLILNPFPQQTHQPHLRRMTRKRHRRCPASPCASGRATPPAS